MNKNLIDNLEKYCNEISKQENEFAGTKGYEVANKILEIVKDNNARNNK
ncbi:MAG: hypothetical protein LBT91_01010 [Bifidobacteriaceae bacterium]|jgi:maleate cis-trans isomerase|nr:hypothetical protein [Bifidobacteriaceae bacterium]